MAGRRDIDRRQRQLLDEWFPDAVVERDHSWGLTGTVVLQVRSDGGRYIVKAAPPGDSHLSRELRAHAEWLSPWITLGRAPRLVHANAAAAILATEFLPGHLVLGSQVADDAEAYRQAGELLRLLHQQQHVVDHEHESRANTRMRRWLDGPHRIAPVEVRALRRMLDSWPNPPVTLVPTHGDWQPRNWLWNDGALFPIDFGRASLRPAMTDFARLDVQEFRKNPALETAFLDGYGTDPRVPEAWFRTKVREAVGTAAWAFMHDDEAFEQQGHTMIADVLGEQVPRSGSEQG